MAACLRQAEAPPVAALLASLLVAGAFTCASAGTVVVNADVVAAACPGRFADGASLIHVANATFAEGPVDFAEAHATLFTDFADWTSTVPTVYKYDRSSGVVTPWLRNTSVGGMARAPDGGLVLALRRARSVGVIADPAGADPRVTVRASAFQGKRLNAPNDVVADADGGVYFTDPAWGVEEADRQLDFKGIYYLPPGGGNDDLVLVGKQNWPNGLGLLPDGRLLVANEQQPLGWYLYTRVPGCDGAPPSWARSNALTPEGPQLPHLPPPEPVADRRGNDGLHVDAGGAAPPVVYATGYRGLWVMAPPTVGRAWWVTCVLPPPPAVKVLTNVATGACGGDGPWGGLRPDARCLYITAEAGMYKIPLA